jgi:hypothetical protein
MGLLVFGKAIYHSLMQGLSIDVEVVGIYRLASSPAFGRDLCGSRHQNEVTHRDSLNSRIQGGVPPAGY